VVGSNVTVTGVDSTFNGYFTITAVTATTFSYALTASNVTSQSANGFATVANGDVAGIQRPDQSTESQIWKNNLLQSDTDAFGNTESFAYDSYKVHPAEA
jgi:hypothetical protein